MADANLNENLNIVSESGLDIQLLDGDLNIIQKLDDEPNDVGGMTSAELKATFDKAGNIIKDYLNNQLVPAILAADATEAARAEAEAARQSAETGREQAEAERVAAEEDRASAEAARSVWEDYNADKAYVPGNKVAYEGSSYLNISACAGIEPTNTDYWLLIARKGDPGTGDGGGGDYLPTSGGSLYGTLYFRAGEDMLIAAKLQGSRAPVNDNSEDDPNWGEPPEDRKMLRLSKLLYITCTAGECGLNLNGGRICKVGDPTYTMDVANKRYVDGQKYTLPIASSTKLGGVQPAAKTDAMTQAVGVDDAGALWTAPGGGSVDVDATLTQSGKAADAAAVGDALSALSEEIANLPSGGGGTTDYTALSNKPKINGVELSGDKTSADLKIGTPSDEQVANAVEAWLDEHPEATSTVEDGSITEAKLADGAVSAQKAGFLAFSGTGENLFNKATVTLGVRRYQAAPWNILTDETMCLSDLIPVEANTSYLRSANSFEPTGATVAYQYTFYLDADKNVISSLRHYYDSKVFTTPENCAYIQLNIPMTCKDIAMLVKGSTEPSEYIPYKEFYRLGEAITIGVNNIESLSAIFEAMPDGSITGAKLADEVTDEIESVDSRINTAAGWNDVRQPTKKLTGRINVFEHTVKGVFDIASDISDKTIVVHGVNYFDTSDMIPGSINFNNGTISPSTTSYYTEHLIPVQPGKALYLNRSNADGVRSYLSVHYYGANQEWLRYKLIGGASMYTMFTPEEDAYYIRVSCGDLVDADAEKVCIADVDIGATLYGGYDGNSSIVSNGKTYFGKNVYSPYVGYRIENGVLVGASDTYTVEEITHVDVFDSAATIEVTAPIKAFDQDRLRNVVLKYGRYAGTDYVMARIFKNTITGDNIAPRVLAFTPGGKTVANLAKENDFVMAINAGIFNTDDNSCLGTTISNGVVITDHVTPNLSGAGDTLGVDSNGNFVSIAYDTTTQDMLANGITQAIQGWATIISNYAKSDLDALKEVLYPSDGTYGTDYIVTAKHPRTACGQYANGDYMVFLCGGRQANQAGMTLAEMQELFVDEGVKFAYNLDGGGSCNGYFYKRETAPYTENRADPSYIVFD